MFRYIIRRILQFIPVFFGATFLIFAMVFAIPGDPIQALAGDKPVDPTTKAVLEDRYNLEDPLLEQYGKYIGLIPQDPTLDQEIAGEPGDGFAGVLQGEFGYSLNRRPVSDIMADAIPKTAKLALMAFVFEIVLGISAGVIAGLRRGSFADNLVLVSTLAVIAIPVFVAGYAAQLIVGVRLGWAPVNAAQATFGQLILPAMVLGATSLAYIARLTRTSLNENLRADYVKTATAKGLPRTRVIGRHTLRNSLIPVITYLGIDLGALMGGAIITEGIFNIPGIGRTVFEGIIRSDGPVVVGVTTFLVVIFMISNLLVDVMYAWLDPRIRYE
ncbi:ABC transporter permease [Salsipaludibacter albus]|uniref:ABC transporter permease n=1 Tax=Salsipaludibacter albus TaxID=2849650 RepID=UPI001EE4A411|nr:ABC transporter permease [Salsipaludibacter albus]MBY5161691.1 ABC transporter permease [Salsipaludibacter albus]